jgi:DNA-binding transcriptional MerR regulator
MSRFLIGQVCNALGIRAHVLRYWERHVELLSPAKDRSGRRMYTLRDVQLLFRLKYLVYTRGMSVEGASRKLVEEVQGGGQNRKAALDSLRGDLFRVSLGAQRLGERLEAASARPAASSGGNAGAAGTTGGADGAETRRTTHAEGFPAEGVAAEVRAMVEEALRRSQAAPEEASGHEAAADGRVIRAARHTTAGTGAETWHSTPGADAAPAPPAATATATATATGNDGFAAARDLLRRAPLLVVTPAPAFGHTVERYPGLLPLLGRGGETVLDRIGGRLSALARGFGHEPLWIVGAAEPVVAAVRGHVARRGFYGLSPGRIRVYAEPRLAYGSAEGSALTAANGLQPAYELPLLSALRTAARHVEDAAGVGDRSEPSEPFGLTLILPITNALPRVPDLEFISRHLDAGAGVSVKAARSPGTAGTDGTAGTAAPTGEALLSTEMHAVVPRVIPEEVRRFGGEDDILETAATRGRFEMEQLLEAADIGLIFEIDARTELASLRSPADWDACSQQVRERS